MGDPGFTRRLFLQGLVTAATAAAIPIGLIPPSRKIWQVPTDAPVPWRPRYTLLAQQDPRFAVMAAFRTGWVSAPLAHPERKRAELWKIVNPEDGAFRFVMVPEGENPNDYALAMGPRFPGEDLWNRPDTEWFQE